MAEHLYAEQVLVDAALEDFIKSFGTLFSFDYDFLGYNEVRYNDKHEVVPVDDVDYNNAITGIEYLSNFARKVFYDNKNEGLDYSDTVYNTLLDLTIKKTMEEYYNIFVDDYSWFDYRYSRVNNVMAITTILFVED